MKREKKSVINIGTTSLLLVFAVLAMVTFALLSLSSASAKLRLAKRMADRTAQYYAAETAAAGTLAALDEKLAAAAGAPGSAPFDEAARSAVGELEGLRWEDGLVCFEIPVEERQQLEIALRLVYPQEEGHFWEIRKWKLAGTESWENRQTLELFQ